MANIFVKKQATNGKRRHKLQRYPTLSPILWTMVHKRMWSELLVTTFSTTWQRKGEYLERNAIETIRQWRWQPLEAPYVRPQLHALRSTDG